MRDALCCHNNVQYIFTLVIICTFLGEICSKWSQTGDVLFLFVVGGGVRPKPSIVKWIGMSWGLEMRVECQRHLWAHYRPGAPNLFRFTRETICGRWRRNPVPWGFGRSNARSEVSGVATSVIDTRLSARFADFLPVYSAHASVPRHSRAHH